MERRHPFPITKKQTAAETRARPPGLPHVSAARLYSAPVQLKRKRQVNYVPGELPREEPPDAPRLFIRGLGGSIKMDLRGVGTRLSPGAFAYHVPDNSLAAVHLRCGDIVLIEPSCRAFRAGNLILLEIEGRATLKRLTKRDRIWFLNSLDPADAAPIPLVDQPLQGLAVGIVRLFGPMKPVKYRISDTNREVSFTEWEKGKVKAKNRRAAVTTRSSAKTKYTKHGPSAVVLAAEKKKKFLLSEVDKKVAYRAWPNTR